MVRPVVLIVGVGSVLSAGCRDITSVETASSPRLVIIASQEAPQAGTLASLDDAASRATRGLLDADAAAVLQSGLAEIRDDILVGDAIATRRDLSHVRGLLAQYAARAPEGDAADRDVIALALAEVDALLRSSLPHP